MEATAEHSKGEVEGVDITCGASNSQSNVAKKLHSMPLQGIGIWMNGYEATGVEASTAEGRWRWRVGHHMWGLNPM